MMIAAIVLLVVLGVYTLWRDHEARQVKVREQERKQEFHRVMQITHDLNKRGPGGFGGRAA